MNQVNLANFINPFLKEDTYQIRPLENGANNLSYKVEVGEVSYILRIYRNHNNLEKLYYENEILQMLKEQELSFTVPAPILSVDNEPYVMHNGKMAVLCPYIEGVEANRETIPYLELGKKIAELGIALQNCKPTLLPSFAPTYQLFNVHPKVNFPILTEFSQSQGFQVELKSILDEVELLKIVLPVQIIHGDLMLSNILLKEGSITGILDFEFVSPDFGMTEVTIAMSQFIREGMDENNLILNLSEFIKGYCCLIQPSDDEIKAIPTLIKVRMVTLLIHFLGRYLDGLDPIDVHQNQLKRFYFVCNWVNKRSEEIVRIFLKQKNLHLQG